MRCTLFLFCPKYYRKFSLYMKKTKKTVTHVTVLTSRDDWIRTSGPYVPNVVLYQTEPHPDMPSYGSCEKQRRWHVKKGGIAAFQRRRWDSNPRYVSVQLISSQSRYDHFDTSPYLSLDMEVKCIKKENRDDWIRTSGPYVPNVVLYQTEPHPDNSY